MNDRISKRELLFFVVIIAIQILVVSYWENNKVNFHVDELYSMGYASSFTGVGDGAVYITTSADFGFDRWINNGQLKKYLVVSKSERFYNGPLGKILVKFAMGSSYVGLLNISESFFGGSNISAKPGVILNILFFVIASASLLSLMKKLNMDERIRYISFVMLTFSGYMLSTVIYVRFYMLVIMLMLIILNLFYRLWVANTWKQVGLFQFSILILTYLSYRNSEFAMPFIGAFMLCFMVASLLLKKRKQLISSVAVGVAGLLFIATTSDFIGILLNPGKYDLSNGVYVSASANIRNASGNTIMEYVFWLKKLFETSYFSSRTIIYGLIGAITIICVVVSGNREEGRKGIDVSRIHPIIPRAIIVWVGILGVSIALGQGRFICLLVLYILILVGVIEATGLKIVPAVRIRGVFSQDTVFVLIILSEMTIYTLFVALCHYNIWRYYCYGFVSATIVIWYVVDRMLKRPCMKPFNSSVIIVLTLFVIINALLLFKTRNIENLYEGDKEFVESIKQNQDLDVVLISEIENGVISRHEAYDCINMIPVESNIFFVNIGEYEYDKVDYPEEFILWSYIERDITRVKNDLTKHGYEMKDIGSDHCSKAYICKIR